jgi:hypothetical protein
MNTIHTLDRINLEYSSIKFDFEEIYDFIFEYSKSHKKAFNKTHTIINFFQKNQSDSMKIIISNY